MRHFPFAAAALAIAAFIPASISARPLRAKAIPAAHHTAALAASPSHVQHSQPAAFHAPSPRKASHKGAEHSHPQYKAAHKRGIRYSTLSKRTRSATRREFSSIPPAKKRLVSQPSHRSYQQSSRSRATLEDPAQPAAVVSVIRPTSDHPQLPSIQQAATEPILLPTLYNERGRLIMPAALVGSHEILVRQNEMADQDGLGRVQDDADLEGMRARGMLVALPAGGALVVDDRLPYNRRYCRPWAARFLATMARAHYAHFHTPLQVNSAVRTVAFQQRLKRTNGNAAPAEGDTASPHLTGQAIDLAKRGLTLTEIAWMRGYLLPLIQERRIDVEEEFQQSCFHISVYRRYLPPDAMPQRYSVARTTSALATATMR